MAAQPYSIRFCLTNRIKFKSMLLKISEASESDRPKMLLILGDWVNTLGRPGEATIPDVPRGRLFVAFTGRNGVRFFATMCGLWKIGYLGLIDVDEWFANFKYAFVLDRQLRLLGVSNTKYEFQKKEKANAANRVCA